MDAARTVFTQSLCLFRHAIPTRDDRLSPDGVLVLDIVYVLGILALFVVVGVIARGVEKL